MASEELNSFLEVCGFSRYLTEFEECGIIDTQDILDKVDEEFLKKRIGMPFQDSKIFLDKVDQLKSGKWEPVGIEEDSRLLSKKLNLTIYYQLFTSLYPTEGFIESINTEELHYFDLVNMICKREINNLGQDLTIELYTCEGFPMATYPGAYIRKLSDWCLEYYPDTPLLYAIPRPKIYTDKQCKHSKASLAKGEDELQFSNIYPKLKANFQTGTYFELCNTIQTIIGIPTHLLHLKYNDQPIDVPVSENLTLNKLNIPITSQRAIEICSQKEFWMPLLELNFSFTEYQPTWYKQQSIYGKSQFYSCLYALSKWVYNESENEPNVKLKILGHLRSIIGCPPLIHSLYLLFSKEILTLPHLVSISEMLLLCFNGIKPKQYKGKCNTVESIGNSKITEHSHLFWTYILSNAERYHANTECFELVNLTCQLKFTRMENPMAIINPKGCFKVIDKKHYNEGSDENLKVIPEYKRLTTSTLKNNSYVWLCSKMYTCSVDLTPVWTNLKTEKEKYPPLCFLYPLQVKSSDCPNPAMIPIDKNVIAVYIGHSKDGSNYDYFDVIKGEKGNFDVEDLDKSLKQDLPMCWPFINPTTSLCSGMERLTRIPDEIILVVLDTSYSMESIYFSGKTKYESVIEAFLAFSNRTFAYDLKNAIGLILFANNYLLQYPISENLKYFTSEFTSLPKNSNTAVYDAIIFAIQKFDSFNKTYPEYSKVPKRILCLTDGEDNASTNTPEHVANCLLINKILMDTVLLTDVLQITHYIAKASGGYSFQPKSTQELLSIFENEPMLTLSMRKCKQPILEPYPESKSRKGIIRKCTKLLNRRSARSSVPKVKFCIDWLTNGISPQVDCVPEHVLPLNIHEYAMNMHEFLSNLIKQEHRGEARNTHTHTRRLLQELAHYACDPHEAFEIFPNENTMDFWQLIMVAPKQTCYDGGIFHLFIEFTDKYPSKPPNIRFITPIYHCNINQAGKICHSIFDRNYTPCLRIRDILNFIYGLLMDPSPEDPLDSVKAAELIESPDSYFSNAKAFTEKYAKKFRTKIQMRATILRNETDTEDKPGVELVCPLTGNWFKDPVLTIYGSTYDCNAILEHIRSGNEYDPFSYLPLKEDQLYPNIAIKKLVAKYLKTIEERRNMN